MKSFLTYFATKVILLNILQNLANYLNILFCTLGNSSKWYVSILRDNFVMLQILLNAHLAPE